MEDSYTNKEGEEHHGDFEFDFSAKGFGPGCNPQTTPRFTLSKAEPEPEPEPKRDRESAEPSKGPKSKKSPAPDAREHDQGEDAPVAPPDQSGYAK